MLSVKEIETYVHGAARMQEKRHFSFDEARQVGKTLGIRWDKFDVEQFAMGLNVEVEHGRRDPETDVTHDAPILTGKIALAHLNEIPDYYTRLAVMEQDAERVKSTPRRQGL
jgi:hypothetical protein